MPDADLPQIYLITPDRFEPSSFGDRLAGVLDGREVGCVRMTTGGLDTDTVMRMADHLRGICHGRDVALVLEAHTALVPQLGLDGVHLPPGDAVRDARKQLGKDSIVGAGCGTSRHAGMTAGEAGADYVSFGPMSIDPRLGKDPADVDLIRWWSEMIEVPSVAEGGLGPTLIDALTPVADFLAFGEEIWSTNDPLRELNRLLAP
ncbi:MAG: thiamine phosphate synthase [Pseudomonadota bacterium]